MNGEEEKEGKLGEEEAGTKQNKQGLGRAKVGRHAVAASGKGGTQQCNRPAG